MALPSDAFAIVANTAPDVYYLQDIAAQPCRRAPAAKRRRRQN